MPYFGGLSCRRIKIKNNASSSCPSLVISCLDHSGHLCTARCSDSNCHTLCSYDTLTAISQQTGVYRTLLYGLHCRSTDVAVISTRTPLPLPGRRHVTGLSGEPGNAEIQVESRLSTSPHLREPAHTRTTTALCRQDIILHLFVLSLHHLPFPAIPSTAQLLYVYLPVFC